MSATLPDSEAGIPTIFKAEIQDESLEFADSDAATNSGDVLTAIAETDVEEGDLRDPPNGRHFVRLEVDPAAGQSGPYPVELGVRVTGKVIGPGADAGGPGRASRRRRPAAAPTTGTSDLRARGRRRRRDRARAGRGRRGGGHGAEADRVRRALLGALAVLALTAAPAAAQAPIAGGGSFNDAPVLKPGRYTDTLRGGEQLFYAVELKPGQKLTAGATVKGRTDSSYFMTLQIYNPLRAEDVFDGEQTASYGQRDRSASLRVEGQRVGEDDGGTTDDLYAEPGTYYVSLNARRRGQQPRGGAVRHLDRPPGDRRDHPGRRRPTATAEPAETAEPEEETGRPRQRRWRRRRRRRARDGDRARPRARRPRRVRRQAAAGGLAGSAPAASPASDRIAPAAR